MAHPYWPLFDIRLRTERLELRWPTDDDCLALTELAGRGIHKPGWMPFAHPWTEQPSPERERTSMQFYWSTRANWKPESWNFVLVTLLDDEVVGTQSIGASDFAIRKVVESGSWLGQAFQGQGLGKEQRAAVLELAFTGLGATRAESAAREDNRPSLGVSKSLGYEENGDAVVSNSGKAIRQINLKLSRQRWESCRSHDVQISGLAPCLELFGAATTTDAPDEGAGS